jgi:hypothetical protein
MMNEFANVVGEPPVPSHSGGSAGEQPVDRLADCFGRAHPLAPCGHEGVTATEINTRRFLDSSINLCGARRRSPAVHALASACEQASPAPATMRLRR